MQLTMKSLTQACVLSSALLIGPFGSAALSDEGSLTLPPHINEPIILSVDGEHSNPSKQLQVFVGTSETCCENRKPIAGRYKLDGGELKFMPMFDLVEGQNYVVKVRSTSNPSPQLTEFALQSEAANIQPEVLAIYPSGDVLPENTLRFYVHFSTPMQPHVAFDHIKLINKDGNEDDAAFMKFKQELWNKDRTRLTVLMDPGRIKRGVSTNLELGPALEAGNQYQLVVKDGWSTASGTASLDSYSKPYTIDNGLRGLPDQNNWNVSAPTLQTKDAVEINFDRPFDFGLLHTAIRVVTNADEIIPGRIVVGNHETQWRLMPDHPWADRNIQILIDSRLEDVAGNNFRDLLDHKVGTGTKNISQVTIAIELHP